MRKIVTAALAISALGFSSVAGVAFATDKSSPNDTARSQSKDKRTDPDRIVCHVQDETGSRLGATKICHTAAEWSAISKEAQSAVMQTQNASKQSGTPGG